MKYEVRIASMPRKIRVAIDDEILELQLGSHKVQVHGVTIEIRDGIVTIDGAATGFTAETKGEFLREMLDVNVLHLTVKSQRFKTHSISDSLLTNPPMIMDERPLVTEKSKNEELYNKYN